jgi:hypothetical protein
MIPMESSLTIGRPSFSHVSQILFGVDSRLAELHLEARENLVGGDREGYDQSLREQAEIVAGLSGKVCDFMDDGGQVAEEVITFAASHSELARQALEEGWDYTRIAFFPFGADKKGPSTLRLLGHASLNDTYGL